MRLTPEIVAALESELLKPDPWASGFKDVPGGRILGMEICYSFKPTGEPVFVYEAYLITCFLFLLEAHDDSAS